MLIHKGASLCLTIYYLPPKNFKMKQIGNQEARKYRQVSGYNDIVSIYHDTIFGLHLL